YWQTFRHRARERTSTAPETREPLPRPGRAPGLPPSMARQEQPRPPPPRERWDVSLSLGTRRAYPLDAYGLIAAEAVALAPDEQRLAFIGIDRSGQKDVYVLDRRGGERPALTRITEDVHGERYLAWGPRGLLYASNATGHDQYNLFLAPDDDVEAIERLT